HEVVIIVSRFSVDAFEIGVCQLIYFKRSFYREDSSEYKALSKFHVWDVPDPSAKMISKTVSFRQTLERSPLVLSIMTRVRYIFEAHLHHYIIAHELGAEAALKQLPVKATFEQISFCKSSTLVMG